MRIDVIATPLPRATVVARRRPMFRACVCDELVAIGLECRKSETCYFDESRLDGLRTTPTCSNVILRVHRVQLTVVWLVECESWGKLSEIKR